MPLHVRVLSWCHLQSLGRAQSAGFDSSSPPQLWLDHCHWNSAQSDSLLHTTGSTADLFTGCNRWQMIRLCCNLFVFILIRDKHLCHRGSVLIWFWGHIKTFYYSWHLHPLPPTHTHPHTQLTHTVHSGLFSLIHGRVWLDESELASAEGEWGVWVG